MFSNRIDAASKLAERLQRYKGQNPLVLAIPRGGVPMGKVIADSLDGDLDVVLVHKLGHPANPEFAFGAIDENGNVYVDSEDDRNKAVEAKELARLKQLRLQYTPLKTPVNPKGRIVIIVDDGIATGWTVKAAIAMLVHARASKIIIAVPVGPQHTLNELKSDPNVFDVLCLEAPSDFAAVGEFYRDFSQVQDQEVADILASRR